MLKRFAAYYRPHWKLFTFDMVCAFLAAVCDLFYPLIAKDIINDYVPNQNMRLLLVWVAVLLGIYLFKAVLTYIVQYWGHIVGVRIQGDMREKMFRHLQKLPFAFFDENKTGTIMSRMINDLMDISELAHHGPEDLFISVIQLAGAFVMLCTINVPLTLIVFAVLPFIVFFAQKTRHMMKDAFRETRVEMAEINANIETAIAGIRVSRSYTADAHETNKFVRANQRFKAARGRAYRSMGVFFSGMGFMMDFLYLLVLFAGGLFFFKGWINTGEFAAYLLYISMFLKPIQKLVNIFEQLQNGITGFQRYEEILAQEPEAESPEAEEVDTLYGEIDFDHVTFRYENSDASEDHKDVIHDLSFHLEPGKMVAFVGPSGGGKTTVCHLIPRFYEIQSGSIAIDGRDIRNISRFSLRKNIGMVAQDVFIFDGTIRENIAYGDLDATEEQIIDAAKKARIHDYILTLEEGYDTQVGERGVRLSGGQKQRLSIARAFLKNPPILILDEATSALDNMTEMQIQESLEELSQGRTTLVVAHRLSTIKNADEILVLTDKGIEERGSHETLLEHNGLYAKLYQYTLL